MVETSAISSNYLKPIWNGTKRVANGYCHFVFGVERNDVFSAELSKLVRGTKNPTTKKYEGGVGLNNFDKNLKTAWAKSADVTEGKSFIEVAKNSLRQVPEDFKGLKGLKFFGEGGQLSGVFKIAGKRMPLIGNVLLLGMEVPNLFRAFTDRKNGGGITTGVVETGKAAAKLGGFAAGAALGQALLPFLPLVGALAGGIIGGWATDKLVGKSFTEKKEEAVASAQKKEQAQVKAPTQQQPQQNIDPSMAYQTPMMNPYEGITMPGMSGTMGMGYGMSGMPNLSGISTPEGLPSINSLTPSPLGNKLFEDNDIMDKPLIFNKNSQLAY